MHRLGCWTRLFYSVPALVCAISHEFLCLPHSYRLPSVFPLPAWEGGGYPESLYWLLWEEWMKWQLVFWAHKWHWGQWLLPWHYTQLPLETVHHTRWCVHACTQKWPLTFKCHFIFFPHFSYQKRTEVTVFGPLCMCSSSISTDLCKPFWRTSSQRRPFPQV